VVQARWQTSGGKAVGGVTGIVKELYRQGGAMAFSRGLGVRILYAVSSFLYLSLEKVSSSLSIYSIDPGEWNQYDSVRITQAMERNLVESLSLHSLRIESPTSRLSLSQLSNSMLSRLDHLSPLISLALYRNPFVVIKIE